MEQDELLDYTDTIFQRERMLDSYEIVVKLVTKGFFKKRTETVVEGDVEQVLSFLQEYAKTQKVPFVAGDLERTNRVPEHEARMRQDPAFCQAVRRAYAMNLVGAVSNFNPKYMPPAYEPQVQAAMQNELLMNNPFVPLVERRPKVQEAFLGGGGISVG